MAISIHICLAAQFTLDAPSDRKASAIFIDSEGSFVIERVASMAAHFIDDFGATSTRPRMVLPRAGWAVPHEGIA